MLAEDLDRRLTIIERRQIILAKALGEVLSPDAARHFAKDWEESEFPPEQGWMKIEDLTPQQRAELEMIILPKKDPQ